MRVWLVNTLFGLVALLSTSAFAAHAGGKSTLAQCLNAKLTPLEKTTQVGLIAENLTTGKLLYSKNPEQSFLPASVIKLVTAIAALAYLPENYQFETSIHLAGKQLGNRFSGQAYFKFSGDPSFKSSYITRFVKKLYSQGIRTFNGNVIVDRSEFAAPDAAPGWLVDNVHICYAAPINALILDENCRRTSIYTKNSQVVIKPKFPFSFINQVKINHDQKLPCSLEVAIKPGNQVVLYGCMQQEQSYGLALAVRDPVNYLEQRLKQGFKARGIVWRGQVKEGSLASSSKLLMSFHSQTLNLIIQDMLATSNNIEAEALLKKVRSALLWSRR
ncbi:D-alanyl-D-alanine carboxypeptidase/D-alanyl-D-alanine endopeptidase [Piscirickettsia litoralis]|uniref:D-alanyl-D-alanine carboxypeptidase/D-alanyl-D-alanine-endopeptidase n=1 Tax=Piscirickettsia litoralis TaxID=1891921 RepID=A0ABX3A5J8_9GAMM|nr:D-alanyl-D-alanine carboxypeptidase/D-alanyl-D-alanine-endopeptidase [Piscirickettsia litoralis]ODN42923.1 D-alanyl-D-alanine carboxypeptidase/D-alanyl-D-alanine-endopeptidase [Piscirickettsia litoralis]